jgi:Flp pilus assembly protein TadD
MACLVPIISACSKGGGVAADTSTAAVPPKTVALVHRAIGYNKIGSGNYEGAVKELTTALQSDPDDWTTYHYRGLAYMLEGDSAAAIDDLSTGTVRGVATTFFYRGMAHYLQGDAAWAVGDFEEAMRLEPKSAYYSIWLYVVRRRNYQQESLARSKLIAPADGIWPDVLIRYVQGVATEQQIRAEVGRAAPEDVGERSCFAEVMLGQLDLVNNQAAAAANRFRRASDVCPKDAVELAVARAELKRM